MYGERMSLFWSRQYLFISLTRFLQENHGDTTSFELFPTDIRGWEDGLRQMFENGKSCPFHESSRSIISLPELPLDSPPIPIGGEFTTLLSFAPHTLGCYVRISREFKILILMDDYIDDNLCS